MLITIPMMVIKNPMMMRMIKQQCLHAEILQDKYTHYIYIHVYIYIYIYEIVLNIS